MENDNNTNKALKELGLFPKVDHTKKKKTKQKYMTVAGPSGAPNATDVLGELLRTNVLTAEAVRGAFEAVESRKLNADAINDQSSGDPMTKSQHHQSSQTSRQQRTRHVAMRLYYDGSRYSGLAQNMGHEDDNSVERILFAALVKTHLVQDRSSSGYSRCGRTDKGVSASGQVVAFRNLKSTVPLDATRNEEGTSLVTNDELPKNESESITAWVTPKQKKKNNANTTMPAARVQKQLSELPYAKMLNNVLPSDIRILGWCPVSDDFSARFSANSRTYRYFFIRRTLDLDLIRQALQLMVGKHDFRNFCKMDVEKVYNFERTIHEASVITPSTDDLSSAYTDVCYFEIHGQAFLWHQIRCIVSVLFLVGQGLEEPSVVTELLDISKHPGKPSYPLAAEQPLVLHDCGYPNLQLGHSAQNLFALSCLFDQQWEELTLAGARVKNGMDRLLDAPVLRSDVVAFVTRRLQERNRKQNKYRQVLADSQSNLSDTLGTGLPSDPVLTWGDAVQWMASNQCRPDAQCLKEVVHVPLLERSRGTTYEEKIEALHKGSEKRRLKYEENVIKKRKSAEEDAAFYSHMMKQGGSGI